MHCVIAASRVSHVTSSICSRIVIFATAKKILTSDFLHPDTWFVDLTVAISFWSPVRGNPKNIPASPRARSSLSASLHRPWTACVHVLSQHSQHQRIYPKLRKIITLATDTLPLQSPSLSTSPPRQHHNCWHLYICVLCTFLRRKTDFVPLWGPASSPSRQ